jgi:hypothetical protein
MPGMERSHPFAHGGEREGVFNPSRVFSGMRAVGKACTVRELVQHPTGGSGYPSTAPDATKRRMPLEGCADVAGEWDARSHPNHTALLRQRTLGEREDDLRAGI